MNDNNSPFGFQSDNSFDPFDPFGIGDSSQSFQTNQQNSSSQPPKDDGITVKQVQDPTPQTQQTSSGDSGIKVKDMSGDDTKELKKEEPAVPANFKIGDQLQNVRIALKPHSLNFNEEHFLKLLAGSISLNRDEKKRILDSIPKLKQSQVDELINIFEDESKKFAELPEKHKKELEKLDKKHRLDWLSIEDEYLQVEKKAEDDQKAAELRKKLGL